MKKILFSAYNLDLGGIEKALLYLINYLENKGYNITLILEKKEGVFLDNISKNVKVIEYKVNNNKNILIRKIKNMFNQIKFYLKYKNKFDFSASFATYSIPGSYIARVASKNNALWGHADYYSLFNGNIEEMKVFFEERKYNKFKHIIFVSEEGKESFIKVFPETKNKVMVCNNLINAKTILEKSKEEVKDLERENIVTFLNVGRHDEKQKKLSRIVEASKRLKEENKKFRVICIGEGQDTNFYKNIVEKYNLKNEIIFLGKKENPYSYFNLSDYIILSSDYEGFPVVYLESFILNKPIITTKVSDYKQVEGRGILTEKTVESTYKAMKEVIENGYEIKNQFDYNKYNEEISKRIEDIINERE